jgi:hypothetical protein
VPAITSNSTAEYPNPEMARKKGTAPEPAKKNLKSDHEIEQQVERVRGSIEDDDKHYFEEQGQSMREKMTRKRVAVAKAGKRVTSL